MDGFTDERRTVHVAEGGGFHFFSVGALRGEHHFVALHGERGLVASNHFLSAGFVHRAAGHVHHHAVRELGDELDDLRDVTHVSAGGLLVRLDLSATH